MAGRPDWVLIAPLMVYIGLLGLVYLVPATWQPGAILLRAVAAAAAAWLLRRHFPPLGRSHWPIAIVVGALAAWGWVAGQHWLDWLGLGGRLPGFPGEKAMVDPRVALGARGLFWATWGARLATAGLVVPVVEELFWRGFLLRALIDWQNFERVPLGKFTWFSFLGTALISTLQHPDNWGVSIACWLVFNGVFYWTRSLLCLMLLHGATNLFLYVMVLRVGDWSFW